MKRIVLKIIPALICGIWFAASCSKEDNTTSTLSIKAVGYIEEPTTKSYDAKEGLIIDTLLFNGDNIEWYNATTSEIKFKSLENTDVFLSVFGGLVEFIVLLDEEKLFTLDAISGFSSYLLNHPVLIEESSDRYIIGRGYPDWEYWKPANERERNWGSAQSLDFIKIREQNWEAIEPGWNKFIAQLKKEGKYRK